MSFVKKLEKKPNFKNSSPSNDSEIWSAMDIDDYEKVMKEASTPEYHLKEKDSELSPEKRKLLREVRDNYRPNSPTKNRRDKPFSVPDKDFAYIDADQTDQLARKNFETVENGAANKFKCGNEETFPVEHDQHDGFGPRSQRNGVEKLNEIQKNIFCNEEEQLKFSSTSQLLNHSVRITSESSGGEFTTFKTTPIGSELVPKLTICEEAKEQLCPGESDRHMKTDEERVIVSIADNKNNRKKKKKKEKGETYVAPAGEFGHLSVEELLKVIEGDEAAEKQTTKKEKRRKSREQQLAKETKESSVNNDETGPRTATTTPEMEITEEKPAAIQNVKRTSTASAGNVAWDDADEEFLSADEGMGSNSRLTTPPAEFVDAKGDIKNISEVLLDGANYRADDEDVAAIAKQLTEEDEFITVGKNKKKIEKRTGSVGEYDRSSPQMNVSGNKRNQDDKGRSMSLHDAKQHQQRRPAAKTFSDLLTDVKNETRGGKHHKRKSTGQEEKEHFLETPVDTEITVNTALPSNNNKQSNPVSPDRVSYADAAKKSAEASGESSPQEVSPASSANRKATYPADTPDPSSETFTSDDSNISHCIAVLPNAAHTSPSPQKFSFFYDEHASQQDGNRLQEASSSTNGVNDPNDFVLKLGGRVVRFAKGHAAEVAKMPKPDARHLALISSLREGWRIFMSDEPPVVFTPRTNV